MLWKAGLSRRKKISKAAILTWCYNGQINYGQIFQCYAMQRFVQKLGYAPKVLRYRKPDKVERFPGKKQQGWRADLYELWYRFVKVEHKINIRIIKFIWFIGKNISLSRQCYTKEQVERECKDCKVLFCGSDQIWNPIVFDDTYFLNFGQEEQKRIAYAPSGIWKENRQPEEFYERIKEYLERFDIITVREEESKEILRNYTEQTITVVVDPTLLLTQKEWNGVASVCRIKEPYIFCYFLGRIRPHRTLLTEIMKMHNVEKIYFTTPGYFEEENRLNQDEYFYSKEDVGPAEFLAMIRGAQAVCTDSYHGLIFSVIYQKQFYIFDRSTPYRHSGENLSRQESMLKKIGIEMQCRIRCKKDLKNIKKIDYASVDLEKCRLETKKLLEGINARKDAKE